jgi:hypothetical protein
MIEFVMLAPIITYSRVLPSTFDRTEKFKLLVRLSPYSLAPFAAAIHLPLRER